MSGIAEREGELAYPATGVVSISFCAICGTPKKNAPIGIPAARFPILSFFPCARAAFLALAASSLLPFFRLKRRRRRAHTLKTKSMEQNQK